MQNRLRKHLSQTEEVDPLEGLANLLDVILVFCCGLMAALILSWNLQGIIAQDISAEEKQRMMQAITRIIEVEGLRELDELPEIRSGGSDGKEMREMGKVYEDPQTGKIIMIQKN